MNIILEGSDCVGKTTFANKLASELGAKVVKGSSFEISELGSKGMFEHSLEILNKENVIVDRFFYSNLVYGSIFKYPMMSDSQYKKLLNKMNDNSLLVYLYASEGVIKNRMNYRGDDMVNIDNIEDILNGYKEAIFKDFSPKFMIAINTDVNYGEHGLDMILNMYKRQQS